MNTPTGTTRSGGTDSFKGGDAAHANHAAVPSYVRLSVPIFAAVTTCLLIWSQTVNCITLDAIINMWPEELPNFDGIVQDMGILSYNHQVAKSGSWFLVVIMGGLSGALPYVKVLGTCVVVLLVDAGKMSVQRSQHVLSLLEAFGKWSYAALLLLCNYAAIFFLATPKRAVMDGMGVIQIDLLVELKYPLVLFCLALALSSFFSHWANYHMSLARPVPGWSTLSAEHVPETNSLLQHPQHPQKIWTWQLLTMLAGSVTFVLFLYGGVLNIISLTPTGAVGMLLGEANERRTRGPEGNELKYSAVMLVARVNELGVSHEATWEGMVMVMLAMFVLLTCFVTPLIEAALLTTSALIHRWSAAGSNWCRIGAEWVYSFDCIEVLLLVIVAIKVENRSFTGAIVGPFCESFGHVFANQALLGQFASKDCMGIDPSESSGFWVFLAGILTRTVTWHLMGLYRGVARKSQAAQPGLGFS